MAAEVDMEGRNPRSSSTGEVAGLHLPAASFLPPLQDAHSQVSHTVQHSTAHSTPAHPQLHSKHQHQHHIKHGHHGGQKDQSHAQPLQRHAALLREKDVQMIKLKQENSLLRQIERRQQRDIEHLEGHEDEEIIRGLRMESSGLKKKLRSYYAQITSLERDVRRISENRQRLREDNQRLEKLISEKSLAEREELTKKVEELVLKVQEHEKKTLDALRKADLTEKNLNVDNRGLRVRVHVLEHENYELTQQVAKLNQLVKDREKHIASLEIYRYTAVHKKPDPSPTVCKACQERAVSDEQQQVRDTISSRLPRLRPPRLSLTISRDVTVSITAPPFLVCNEDGSIKTQYDRLLLRYSEDWGMLDGVRETVVAVAPDQHGTRRGDDEGAESRTTVNDEKHPHDLQEVEPRSESDPGTKPVTPEQCDRFIKDLLPDRTYFFQVLCAYSDISGPASPIASIYIERPKTAARQAELKTEIAALEIVPRKAYKPRLIKTESGIEILAPLTARSTTSRIYCDKHIVNALGESEIDTVIHSDIPVDSSVDEGWFSYIWKINDLEPGTTYSFRIQNGNSVGWGDVSDESEPVQIAMADGFQMRESGDDEIRAAESFPQRSLPPEDDTTEPSNRTQEQPSSEISEPEPTHFVAEQQEEMRTRSPSPEPQPLQASQKTASQLTLNQKIQNMYHGLPANYEPTK